jgi:putative endonuclease
MRVLLRLSDWLRHKGRLRAWNTAHAWGRRGEDLAHRYLEAQGYTIIARNLRPRGTHVELDLIARDKEAIVFVEVKSRASDEFGTPDSAVDKDKRENLVRAASAYLRIAKATWDQARFDIVTVTFEEKLRIEHLRDAFNRPPL